MKNFEDLIVWQEAIALSKSIYQLTKSFSRDELFGITSQIRRSAVSVPSNIAEGFGRRQPRDKEHFYVMALGSLMETKSLIYVSKELGYVDNQQSIILLEKITDVHKLLNALISSQRKIGVPKF